MSFPLFVSRDGCHVDVDRTFSADTYDDYTDACACFDLTISYALPANHYVDCVYIGIHGASTITGTMYGLWIDSDWSGTKTGTYYPFRISVQSSSTMPDCYIQMQSASPGPTYLFTLGGLISPIVIGAVGGTQSHRLRINMNGTAMYIPLNTA